MTDHWDHL